MDTLASLLLIDSAPPLRVAMVAACPFPANHGTPGAIRELAVTLARLGHEVHVVTYPHGDDIPVEGVFVHRVKLPWRGSGEVKIGPSGERLVFDAFLVPLLRRVVRRHRIDVIHAHNYEAAIAGAMVKWLTGRPLVYNGINSMADELPSYAFFSSKRFALALGKLLDFVVPRTADALILLSDELKDYLESLGIADERMVVMPLGVEPALLAGGDGARVRARFGLEPDTPVVMYTGAIEGFQRIDYLVEAFARVALLHPRAVLMIANNIPNPEARDEILALAAKRGIEHCVLFAEPVSLAELPDYLAAADVAVVPRPSCPGFPLKLLNYMAAGRAIVSFAGSAKSLCHGYNGYVARNHDIADLGKGIAILLDDSALRATLGQRAAASIAGVYDWETIARATALLYFQMTVRRDRIYKEGLSRYLKGAYVPRLATGGYDRPEQFLQGGPIEYPSFAEVAALRSMPEPLDAAADAAGPPVPSGLAALILADIRRKQAGYVMVNKFFNKYVKIALQLGTLAVVVYRIGHWAYTRRHPVSRLAWGLLYRMVAPPVNWVSGVWINPRTPIGPGFVIHNFADVVVDAERIGANCTLNQGVSIGRDWTLKGRPRLGDNVFVGSGAKVLGEVSVDDNVVVAANCLVGRSVGANCLIAGVPGMVVARGLAPDYVGHVQARVP